MYLQTYRKVPKETTLVTFGFSSLLLSLLSEGRYFQEVAAFAKTCIVHGPIIILPQLCKHPHLLFGENYFMTCYCFLKRYSKELFDFGVGIHRRNEHFLEKKDVMYLLSYIKEW